MEADNINLHYSVRLTRQSDSRAGITTYYTFKAKYVILKLEYCN